MSCDYFKQILIFSVERREDGRDPTDGVGPLPQGVLHLLTGLAPNSIFSVAFFSKISLICLEGNSMTPLRGNAILCRSSQQIPRLRLGQLKGFLS